LEAVIFNNTDLLTKSNVNSRLRSTRHCATAPLPHCVTAPLHHCATSAYFHSQE